MNNGVVKKRTMDERIGLFRELKKTDSFFLNERFKIVQTILKNYRFFTEQMIFLIKLIT